MMSNASFVSLEGQHRSLDCPNSTRCLINANLSTDKNVSELYDYDYTDSIDTLYWSELGPPLLVYAVTYALGVTGNFLLVFTITRYRRLKSTTNIFLASLAAADLLLILICIPVKIARLFSFSWTLGYFLCKLIYYFQVVSTTCSVYTMTTLSLERYYAIVHPMRAQYRCTLGKAKAAARVVWIASFVLASPILWVQVHMEVGMRRKAYWCVRDFDSAYVWPSYETYSLILVLVLPMTVMATAYTKILSAVYDMAISRRHMSTASDTEEPLTTKVVSEDKTVRQVVRMLVVVVLLFVACWGPILVLNVLQAYSVLPEYGVSLKHWRTALDLLSYCNSCMNPVVYGFMSKNFRRAFQRALCALGKKERNFSISRSETVRMQRRVSTATVSTGTGASTVLRPNYGRRGRTRMNFFRSNKTQDDVIETSH